MRFRQGAEDRIRARLRRLSVCSITVATLGELEVNLGQLYLLLYCFHPNFTLRGLFGLCSLSLSFFLVDISLLFSMIGVPVLLNPMIKIFDLTRR